MSNVVAFPGKPLFARCDKGKAFRVVIKVLDDDDPCRVRWYSQYDIEKASGYRALDGYTDASVLADRRHRFKIKKRKKLRAFLQGTAPLVEEGRIALWIDGVRIRPHIERAA